MSEIEINQIIAKNDELSSNNIILAKRLKERDDDIKTLNKLFQQKKEENEKLKDNWNTLKKFCEEEIKRLNPKKLSNAEYYRNNPDLKVKELYTYQNMLSKMKEIEENNGN